MKKIKEFLRFVSLLILLITILTTHQQVGVADHHTPEDKVHKNWQRLNTLAEQSLFLIKKQEYEAARKVLNDLSLYFLTIDTSHYLKSVEKVHLLLGVIIEARESLNRAQIDHKQVENKVLRMRLALDAVSHQKQPLWLHYYPTLAKTITDLSYSLESKNRDLFYFSLNELSSQYELIRPAAFLSHPTDVIEQLDSLLSFLNKNKESLWNNKDKASEMITVLDKQLKKVFFQKIENNAQSFIYLLIGIGAFIFTVLSYVAWRKYRGESEKKTVEWRRISE
jgi:sporulation protein YpjB